LAIYTRHACMSHDSRLMSESDSYAYRFLYVLMM
jgi:hypothetical protein